MYFEAKLLAAYKFSTIISFPEDELRLRHWAESALRILIKSLTINCHATTKQLNQTKYQLPCVISTHIHH